MPTAWNWSVILTFSIFSLTFRSTCLWFTEKGLWNFPKIIVRLAISPYSVVKSLLVFCPWLTAHRVLNHSTDLIDWMFCHYWSLAGSAPAICLNVSFVCINMAVRYFFGIVFTYHIFLKSNSKLAITFPSPFVSQSNTRLNTVLSAAWRSFDFSQL